jgi:hypothetical protein
MISGSSFPHLHFAKIETIRQAMVLDIYIDSLHGVTVLTV